MGTGSIYDMIVGMVSVSDALTALGYIAAVFAAIIVVILLLAPVFIAKMGFKKVLGMVSGAVTKL